MMKLFSALMLAGFLGMVRFLVIPSSGSTHPRTIEQPKATGKVGQAFESPYRLTETNHFLVRVRINGKGPFNFLVDSGAPALYIATETASKAHLKPPKGQFWTPVSRLDLEGGAVLTDIKARVEDPFQLVSMNALGLPGATIDGILGFTILARFRLEIDPTRDFMTWTLLDHIPPDPPTPHQANADGEQPPRELRALSALGPLAKGLAFLTGKQPEEKRLLHGFLGFQWHETPGPKGQEHVQVGLVFKGSPADRAGVRPGDILLRIGGHPIDSLQSARAALAKIQAGDLVQLDVRRNGTDVKESGHLSITVTAEEGF
jgi:hypothetical protein